MRQIDLESAFLGQSPSAKDLQDEAGPVEDLGSDGALQVALLGRRESAVEEDEFDLLRLRALLQFVDLALPYIGAGAHLIEIDDLGIDDLEVDRTGQADGFTKLRFRRPRVEIAAHRLLAGYDDDGTRGDLWRAVYQRVKRRRQGRSPAD